MKKSVNIVKVGGHVIEDAMSLDRFLSSFKKIDGRKILVTGGGSVATKIASQLGIESTMIQGRRVTEKPMLEVATMVYAGLLSKTIVSRLQAEGINAIGLCGADMDLIRSSKRPAVPVDYGFVGDVSEVNTEGLASLIEMGTVPILCPITHDGNGQLLNTNADTIAQCVASALVLRYDVHLTFCFEKNGVLRDANKEDSVIEELDYTQYCNLRDLGVISMGMIPKLDNAFKARKGGVSEVIITNAQQLGTCCGTRIV